MYLKFWWAFLVDKVCNFLQGCKNWNLPNNPRIFKKITSQMQTRWLTIVKILTLLLSYLFYSYLHPAFIILTNHWRQETCPTYLPPTIFPITTFLILNNNTQQTLICFSFFLRTSSHSFTILPQRIQESSSRWLRLLEADELDTSEEPLFLLDPFTDLNDLLSVSSNLEEKHQMVSRLSKYSTDCSFHSYKILL